MKASGFNLIVWKSLGFKIIFPNISLNIVLFEWNFTVKKHVIDITDHTF